MLERPGVTVTCCHHPEELLNKLKDKRFDALLTDIQMPAMNGFDLLKAIRTLDTLWVQTLPVIALTARSDMDENYFRSHGFAGCLHKPFTVKELLLTVNEGQLAADEAHITEDMQTVSSLNFSALTAFSEDDADAAHSIIHTFIEETGKNADRMQQALAGKEVDGIAAMAHKLLPLFTLIGAMEAVPLLNWLETQRGQCFSEEIGEKTACVLLEIQKVLEEARKV